jgi:Arc/MetJ-type ribon-helix-helix transcriptional regulator
VLRVSGEECVFKGAACRREHAQYDLRMQKARVTVTIKREVLAKAERQVRRGRAKSVSAWVDAAMEEKARREDLTALLSEMKAENGSPTAKEEAWARAVLGL